MHCVCVMSLSLGATLRNLDTQKKRICKAADAVGPL